MGSEQTQRLMEGRYIGPVSSELIGLSKRLDALESRPAPSVPAAPDGGMEERARDGLRLPPLKLSHGTAEEMVQDALGELEGRDCLFLLNGVAASTLGNTHLAVQAIVQLMEKYAEAHASVELRRAMEDIQFPKCQTCGKHCTIPTCAQCASWAEKQMRERAEAAEKRAGELEAKLNARGSEVVRLKAACEKHNERIRELAREKAEAMNEPPPPRADPERIEDLYKDEPEPLRVGQTYDGKDIIDRLPVGAVVDHVPVRGRRKGERIRCKVGDHCEHLTRSGLVLLEVGGGNGLWTGMLGPVTIVSLPGEGA